PPAAFQPSPRRDQRFVRGQRPPPDPSTPREPSADPPARHAQQVEAVEIDDLEARLRGEPLEPVAVVTPLVPVDGVEAAVAPVSGCGARCSAAPAFRVRRLKVPIPAPISAPRPRTAPAYWANSQSQYRRAPARSSRSSRTASRGVAGETARRATRGGRLRGSP